MLPVNMFIQIAILFLLFIHQAAMAGISIIQRNGVPDIYVNNKKVDLSKANIIEETPEYKVYVPDEDPEVRIIISKNGGLMVTDHGTSQIMVGSVNREMTPEEKAKFDQAMKKLDRNMKQLEERLGNLGSQINRQVEQSLTNVLGPKFYKNFF
ncbi:hypothetical protein O3M35_008636 [Rhynocoris fuscipes]|uniref:Uncharacterized protein n=1 Tax=Rhynocoris fuscipes TaxID=488301 RepID=A0AAW1D9P3_9HEMI